LKHLSLQLPDGLADGLMAAPVLSLALPASTCVAAGGKEEECL